MRHAIILLSFGLGCASGSPLTGSITLSTNGFSNLSGGGTQSATSCEFLSFLPGGCTFSNNGAIVDPSTGASVSTPISGSALSGTGSIDSLHNLPGVTAYSLATDSGQPMEPVSSIALPVAMSLAISNVADFGAYSAQVSGDAMATYSNDNEFVSLELCVRLSGQNVSFNLDSNGMTLSAGAGSSGYISISSGNGLISEFSFGSDDLQSAPIVYSSLGMSLPPPGSDPCFSIDAPSLSVAGPTFSPTQAELSSNLELDLSATVPEPATWSEVMLALAGLGFVFAARKRAKALDSKGCAR